MKMLCKRVFNAKQLTKIISQHILSETKFEDGQFWIEVEVKMPQDSNNFDDLTMIVEIFRMQPNEIEGVSGKVDYEILDEEDEEIS